MKLHYTYDINDYIAYFKHYHKQKGTYRNIRILASIVFLLIMITEVINVINNGFQNFSVLFNSFLFLFLLVFFFFDKISSALNKNLMQKNNNEMFGEVDLTFDSDKIVAKMEKFSSIYKWIAIKKVEETNLYFFIYLSNMTALSISKMKIEENVKELSKLLRDNALVYNYSYFTL